MLSWLVFLLIVAAFDTLLCYALIVVGTRKSPEEQMLDDAEQTQYILKHRIK